MPPQFMRGGDGGGAPSSPQAGNARHALDALEPFIKTPPAHAAFAILKRELSGGSEPADTPGKQAARGASAPPAFPTN